jgi:hypothetical protein
MKTISIDKTKIQEGLDVLRQIQKDIPQAALAGGYLRDAVLGGKPKDIDIFIPYVESGIEHIMQCYSAIELKGAKYMPQTEVTRIWDIVPKTTFSLETFFDKYFPNKIKSKLPVQIIMLNKGLNIEERIQQYDFGLCQIWTLGEEVFITDAFDADIKSGTCTLVCCEDEVQFTRSLRRFNRFRERYPNLLLRINQEVKDELALSYSV